MCRKIVNYYSRQVQESIPNVVKSLAVLQRSLLITKIRNRHERIAMGGIFPALVRVCYHELSFSSMLSFLAYLVLCPLFAVVAGSTS
jgi:hypothetical protein